MFCIWIVIRSYFAFLSMDIFFVLHSIFFEIPVSEIIYFIHGIVNVIVQSVWHSLSLRNNTFALARQIAVIALLSEAIWL